MQIRPTSNIQSTSSVKLQTNNSTSQAQAGTSLPVDQVDISVEAQSITSASGEIRADRVAEIRAQINSGVYETSEKLDVALSRMLDEFV